jgi:hypothetical protein
VLLSTQNSSTKRGHHQLKAHLSFFLFFCGNLIKEKEKDATVLKLFKATAPENDDILNYFFFHLESGEKKKKKEPQSIHMMS